MLYFKRKKDILLKYKITLQKVFVKKTKSFYFLLRDNFKFKKKDIFPYKATLLK